MYAGINIRLFFYCVVYCIAVIFVAARVAFYYLLKANFDFLFNSKCKYDNFLRIAYRQHKDNKYLGNYFYSGVYIDS